MFVIIQRGEPVYRDTYKLILYKGTYLLKENNSAQKVVKQ